MRLIVGLGNPGKECEGTRHNIGFWMVDRLKKEISGRETSFFKNSNFVNEAGKDVKKTISRLKIPLEDVLIIHDDFDLELGQFKLQFNRSSAGHKGVQSVIDELGSQAFWRLRIGIRHPPEGVEADDYVLARFSPQEREILEATFPQILLTAQNWLLKK